uniref:Manganese/iron superoxide dismutase C-terminal domain-containing protein n=1 Tax=Zea mays TaxID=4577 RepID=A0A804QXZ3_MAIZE
MRSRQGGLSRRLLKVVSYYSLTTPPYKLDALEPYMSKRTVELHWEYNNAAQVWNHHFFWESMQPEGGGLPEGGVLQQIEKDFGSFTNFREEFIRSALQLLGSGWVWLVLKRNETKLSVVHTQNAIFPLAFGDIPIINLDLCMLTT